MTLRGDDTLRKYVTGYYRQNLIIYNFIVNTDKLKVF